MVSNILLSITVLMPTVFIARTYGSSALGQYALAYQVMCFPSVLLGGAIGKVYFQRASARWVQGLSFTDIWQSTAKNLILIGLPIYTVASLAMPWLFPFLFGNAWKPAGTYGAILAISAFFSFTASPMGFSSVIVGAWQYLPLWHAARTLATSLVILLSSLLALDIKAFLVLFVIQETMLHLIDFYFEWRFAIRKPI